MAKAILAHDISPVWVPSPEVEGIRDLAGAYDGATARLATAKQRLLAFLAKRGFVYGVLASIYFSPVSLNRRTVRAKQRRFHRLR